MASLNYTTAPSVILLYGGINITGFCGTAAFPCPTAQEIPDCVYAERGQLGFYFSVCFKSVSFLKLRSYLISHCIVFSLQRTFGSSISGRLRGRSSFLKAKHRLVAAFTKRPPLETSCWNFFRCLFLH
jgi:hypothetical protein